MDRVGQDSGAQQTVPHTATEIPWVNIFNFGCGDFILTTAAPSHHG